MSESETRRRYESGSGIDQKRLKEREKEHVEELSKSTRKAISIQGAVSSTASLLTRFSFALEFTTVRDRDELKRSVFRIDGKFAHRLNHFKTCQVNETGQLPP